jgi:hypothetical protein
MCLVLLAGVKLPFAEVVEYKAGMVSDLLERAAG